MTNTEIEKKTNVVLSPQDRFKATLHKNYLKQIQASLGEKKGMEFFTGAIYLVQKTPKLLEVDQNTLFNAIMQTMELRLPIGPTGEVYILPYGKVAQFQLGYKGIVTLLYRGGVQSIRAEIVYEKDEFENINGIIKHKIDIFKSKVERGNPVGAYVIVKLNGEEICKTMNKQDILAIRDGFSKSAKYDSSPWNEKNDPELNMWKKTVLIQVAKYLPQNETLAKAIEIDYENDSKLKDTNALQNNEALEKTLEGFGEAKEGENKNIS